jgi:hypothetical protein
MDWLVGVCEEFVQATNKIAAENVHTTALIKRIFIFYILLIFTNCHVNVLTVLVKMRMAGRI